MRPISLPATGRGHAAPVTHVAFSPSGGALASSSYDGSVVVWRVGETGLEPTARLLHRRLVNAASWSPQRSGWLATAAADKTVGLWHVDAERAVVSSLGWLARHTDDVNAVAWLPDGDRLVSVSEDSTALLWDSRDGRCLGRLTAHAGHCMDVAVSSDGLVLTVGEDGEAFCGSVDRPGGGTRRSFGTSIEGCTWAPDGTRAALACDDGIVRIVSPELDLLEEHLVSTSAARAVAFAAGGRLVVGSYDASVLVLEGDRGVARAAGGRLWPRSLDTSGELVAVGSFGTAPELRTLDALAPRGAAGGDTYGPNALAASGGSLFVGLDAGLVVALPVDQLRGGSVTRAAAIRVSADPVLALASCRGGLLTSTYGGAVRWVDPVRGALGPSISLGAPVPSLASAPDGEVVLAGTYGGDVAVLEVGESVAVSSTHKAHEGSVKSIAWCSSDLAVTGATDGAVRTFSKAGPGEVLWHHGNLVNAVATDGRGLVASASRDHLVRVGRPGASPAALLGADESVKAVAILGEERTRIVLGGSYDFSCAAWVLRDGALPDARAGEVVFVADQAISTMLSLDGRTVVVASWDGTVRAVEWRADRLVVHEPVALATLVEPAPRGEGVLVGGA